MLFSYIYSFMANFARKPLMNGTQSWMTISSRSQTEIVDRTKDLLADVVGKNKNLFRKPFYKKSRLLY